MVISVGLSEVDPETALVLYCSNSVNKFKHFGATAVSGQPTDLIEVEGIQGGKKRKESKKGLNQNIVRD